MTNKANTAEVLRLADHHLQIQNNGELLISTGKSRFETAWKNKTIYWSALLLKLSKSVETPETHAEYMKMSKEQQDRIKDIGGFVGGHLKEGRRKTGYVLARQILTLDLDFPPADFWDNLMNNLEINSALAVYSTHKHSKGTPRYRLIMPLDREVSPDEYEAIARKIAEKIGIDYFDDSTFQPTRLMYWPSNSTGVEPFFKYYDAPFLKADSVLAEYPDWTDTSFWPYSSRMTDIRKRQADKQGDPLAKKGIVGAFCRTYTIPEAIAKFLPDVYTQTAKADRYTYAAGSTAAGLVIYDGETFAYSNHSTDPAGGQLCNAFDLVRIHKFGHLDEGSEDKSGRDTQSYKAMAAFATEDPSTSLTLAKDTKEKAVLDFEAEALPEDNEDWETKLSRTEEGAVRSTITNAVLILQNHPALQGIRFNELSGAVEVKGRLPWKRPNKYWRDADDAQLYSWVADQYGVQFPENKFTKALTVVTDQRRFNPLRDYLRELPEWDGVPRVDTLLVDYLGAEDTPYVRAVTRKTLIGAIQRVLERHRQEHPAPEAGRQVVQRQPEPGRHQGQDGSREAPGRLDHGDRRDAGNQEGRRGHHEGLHQPPGGRVPGSLRPGGREASEDRDHLRHDQQHHRLPERHDRQPALLARDGRRRQALSLGHDRGDPGTDLGGGPALPGRR